ncbi:phosphotransferase [Nocardioides ferulae]|uniref:phosphotransferase n=1 Tax=Nocardioides ferulae TaxID=2340821 RepID=UPI0019812AE6|nr:phosphotransferase [Nocardioides ferulae]
MNAASTPATGQPSRVEPSAVVEPPSVAEPLSVVEPPSVVEPFETPRSSAPQEPPAETLPPLATADELDAAWLTSALGHPVTDASVERVGAGQIGACFRARLSGPGVEAGQLPASVLVKLPSEDPGSRAILAGVYRTEVGFYREVADTVAVAVPACLAATEVSDDGRFTLVLEDLAPAVPGDQLAGAHPDQVAGAAVNLAGLHGPRWCDETLFETPWLTRHDAEGARALAEFYLPAVEQFLDNVGHLISADAAATVRRTVPVVGEWSLAGSARFGLVHGDYRLDNLMFDPAPPPGAPAVHAVDWQTLSVGLPAHDLAYLVGTSLSVDARRATERDLVAAYHRALRAHGVRGYSASACWEDYRLSMLQGVLTSVFGCAYGARTDRGDAMFAVMVERSTAAMRDLDTLALV